MSRSAGTVTIRYGEALALLTRLQQAPEIPREDLLCDAPADEVLMGMEAIAGAILSAFCPPDAIPEVLQAIGLFAAREAAA